MSNTTKIKYEGQIFTPPYLVRDMLDFAGYKGYGILNKHIMENGCGDGAFLEQIVRRYCELFPRESLKQELEMYIHGIEKDVVAHAKCIERLNKVVLEYNIDNVKWDILCGDSLELSKKYYGKMDFVIGNPPYVRVHNLTSDVKRFSFANGGMTDAYLVFFELGFNLLSPTGKMCLITPSSCLYSKAGQVFRNYILKSNMLSGLVDLEHFQPFEASTYTMISLFDKNDTGNRKHFAYWRYITAGQIDFIDNLKYHEAFIDGKIYLARKDVLKNLRDIATNYLTESNIAVKNGIATLADNIFIRNFDFEKNVIDIIKSSTGEWKKCIFPYMPDGTPLTESSIKENAKLWDYLSINRNALENRSIEKKSEWFLFGRSQAIKDICKNKIAINQLIKDKESIKINFVPAGCGVYGGLYVLTDKSIAEIKSILITDEFIDYVKAIKNYKSGGYYTFSSSDLAKFLNYHLTQRTNNVIKLVANY